MRTTYSKWATIPRERAVTGSGYGQVNFRVWTGEGWAKTPIVKTWQCENAQEARAVAENLSRWTGKEVRWNWQGNDHGFYVDAGIVQRQRIANFKAWEGVTWDATDTHTSARCYNDDAAHEKAASLSDLTGRVVRWNWEGSDKAHYVSCDGHPAFALSWDACTVPPVVLARKEYNTDIYRDDDGCYEPRADGFQRPVALAINTLLDDLTEALVEEAYERGLADGQAKVG